MAGDWIKMRADLQTHPKVVRIASALNADRLRAVGGLHAAWCLFDAHSLDGSLDGYTPEALDALIGWPGFSMAMAAVGWLEVSECSLSLPRFDEHNGKSAKRRATETERKRASRMASEDPQNARGMSASGADKKRTREEKRRDSIPPKAPRKRGEAFDASEIELPPWVPREAWALWCADRKKRGKAITEAGARLQLKALDTYRGEGHSAQSVIEHSIAGGFQGLYPPKARHGQAQQQPAADPADWRATWKTIVAKGVELGLGEWSEALWSEGKATDFPTYRARVDRKVRELESGPADEAGQQKIADLIGGTVKRVA